MMDKLRFEGIFADTAAKLRRYVSHMIRSSSDSDDIMQDTYLRLLTSAPNRLSHDQMISYLFATATNIVRDRWRRGDVAGERIPLDDECIAAPFDTEAMARTIDLPKVMESLPLMHRSLLWLAYAEGYSHREIAAIAGIKEESVKVILFRARQKFITVSKKCDLTSEVQPR